MSKNAPEVFQLDLQIGNSRIGEINCFMNLGIATEKSLAQGRSVVVQQQNPLIHVYSFLTGGFSYMCTMKDCHILIVVTGYEQRFGGQPIKNFEARIVLEDTWETGIADYSFLDGEGNWHELKNQKVFSDKKHEINDLKQLAAKVAESA